MLKIYYLFVLIFDFFQEAESTLEEKSQKWNIGSDSWDKSFGRPRSLETAFLSLDEPELEVMPVEIDEDNVEEKNVVVMLSS